MLKRLLIYCFTLLLSCSLFPINAHSDDGILAGAFLRMGIGARAMGMGGAFTAIADGPEASYYNPGQLPFINDHQLMASYRFLSLDRNFNYIGYAQSIKPKVDPDSEEQPFNGGLALSWIYAGVDKIDGRGLNGQPIGEFSNSENAFALSFGISPVRFVGIGINAKVLYNRFPEMKDDDSALTDLSFGMDLGIMVKPLPYVSAGFMIKDMNAKYDWKTDKVWDKDIDKIDRFPKTYRGGVAFHLPSQRATFAFDIEKNDQQDDARYHIGIEAIPVNGIALRAGINDGNFSGGAGYQFELMDRKIQIQYAMVTRDYDVAAEHIFTWLFSF